MKRAAVFGGSGFISTHLCARLVKEGYEVVAYDRKRPEFGWEPATRYHIVDLRDDSFIPAFCELRFDEVYQLAADMGGAGFVFTGVNDADIMANSAQINLNTVKALWRMQNQYGLNPRTFFASSACVYESICTQRIARVPDIRSPETIIAANGCKETEGINPDSDYGLEKLFAEKLYDAFCRNYEFDIRIGRFHNIYGSHGTWRGGREKAPAALCRKIAEARDGDEIEIWGSGQQTRSFLYVDEAVEAVIRLMRSDYRLPVNIGSSECVSIDKLADMVSDIANKDVVLRHVPGPLGVDGRNSDNTLIEYVLGWKPEMLLVTGLSRTYQWIADEVDKARGSS